jgi:asparaginyl-tRNA synthetase
VIYSKQGITSFCINKLISEGKQQREMHLTHLHRHRATVNELLKKIERCQDVLLEGWIRKSSRIGKYCFVHVNDGMSPNHVQAVIPRQIAKDVCVGNAVRLKGNWVPSEGRQQRMELEATQCDIMSLTEDKMEKINYDVQNVDLLREHLHLRPKYPAFASILRLRSALNHFSHKFFMERGFHHIDAPLLSTNDCEGGGETFSVHSTSDADFFGAQQIFLPVSSQLHLEAAIGSLPKVYTIGAAFRAEKSDKATRHLAEFRMLEAECAFVNTVGELCDIVEAYVRSVVGSFSALNEDIECASMFYSKDFKTLLSMTDVTKPFPRITYAEAISLLQERGESLSDKRLTKTHELLLVEHFGQPVFVTHFPSAQKPFYMKRLDDGTTESFDLLAPIVGELAGGSVRENDPEALASARLDEQLQWYTDLRRKGGPVSGGFGIGMERLMQSLVGIPNIKDTVMFPRWFKHCSC